MASTLVFGNTKQTPVWLLLVAAVWICGFAWTFFDQPLNDPEVRRSDLWGEMLDGVLQLGQAVDDDSASATKSGWKFLPQRIPIFAWATVILALAAAHGDAICVLLAGKCRLSLSERISIVLGLGLACLSLVTLGCGLAGQLNPLAITVPSLGSAVLALAVRIRRRGGEILNSRSPAATPGKSSKTVPILVLIILVPFVIYLLLGAVSPPTDFDVREYHLQGPKEWFQQGQVTFLRHNVYTSFPFLSEMLLLAGMVFTGDWWQGALVGQVVLACFQLLSALSVFGIASRWISRDVAWIAALIYLTTPWTLRISLIAYAEGSLAYYLIAAFLVAMLCGEFASRRWQLTILCGIIAGCAMASKYTGLVSVILPTAAVLGFHLWRDRAPLKPHVAESAGGLWKSLLLKTAVCYSVGILLMISPWLLRNVYDTGNPVYPLGYSVLGGSEWSVDMNARWKPAHSPSEHHLTEIPRHFLDAAVRNMWTSPLLFGLGIPAVLLWRCNRTVAMILSLAAWGFVTWWALTHRIDRFWIPTIPLLSLAAGSTWLLSNSRWWRAFVGFIIAAVTAFNVHFCGLALVGFHVGLMDLDAARQIPIRSDNKFLNQTIPASAKVLMVGDAEVFDCTFSLVYSTVFDDCLFEEWTTNPADAELPVKQRRMLPPDEIRSALKSRGITHVVVHWGEILRYRLPGSYGFTEYIQPARFDALVNQGVLQAPRVLLARPWKTVSESDRRTVESWEGYQSLIVGDESLSVVQLFTVSAVPLPK